jgi:uncharacterized OB-fold protein
VSATFDITNTSASPETAAFWAAAAEGRFVVPFCCACAKAHWYPRAFCPFCYSDRVELRPASGRGVIYSYTVKFRKGGGLVGQVAVASAEATDPTRILAFVTLDAGPTMMTNIVECEPEQLRIGQAVTVVFGPPEGGLRLPRFRPI